MISLFSILLGSSVQAGVFAPPPGKTLLFIGQDRDHIQEYMRDIGITPAGFMGYTSLRHLEGIVEPKDHGGGVQHVQWLVDQFDYTSIQLGLYLVGSLEDINQGQLDENIAKLARWIKRIQRPVYLRIGYEFDNPENQYRPQAYRKAFQRIVQHIRREGVTNAAFVWHAQASGPDIMHADWYPGDAYVDWIAVSYFSPYNTENMDKLLMLARRHQKPFMIAESTAVKTDFTDADDVYKRWFGHVFKYIQERGVQAFSYINGNWDLQPMHQHLQWGDARIQQNPALVDKWKQLIRQNHFILASPEHFQTIQFKVRGQNIRHRYF